MEQLRYNAGKPRLSYLFAHEKALAEILYPMDSGNYYQMVQNYLVSYLSGGGRENLRCAVGAARFGLEHELGGEPLFRVEGQPLCGLADAAFCAVCVSGEGKYTRGNFRKGAPVTQYIDSALRHLREIFRARAVDYSCGVVLDAESGEAHGAHVYWNLLEALEQPDWRDDRLPPVQGGDYDNGFYEPQSAERATVADPIAELIKATEEDAGWLDDSFFYESYDPACGCGMCTELRPGMVEVEVTEVPTERHGLGVRWGVWEEYP